MTVVVFDDIVHDWNSFFVKRSGVYSVTIVTCLRCINDSQVFLSDHVDHSLSLWFSCDSKSKQFSASQIVFKCHNVLVQLVQMSLQVSLIAGKRPSELLSTPCDKSDGPFGSQPVFEQKSHSLETSDNTSSVVIGASLRSGVPRVNMTSDKQNFIRLRSSFDLEHQVVRVGIGNLLALKCKLEINSLTSVLHSLKHLGILDCYSCNWDLRLRLGLTSRMD